MLLKKEMSRYDLLDYLYQFDELYGDGLDNTELRFIFKNCELGNYVDKVPYILTQFYTEFDLIREDKNIYLSVLKKIKENFCLEKKRILEVGGGPTPQLGRLLAKEAKEVVVMDTSLSIKNNKLDNLFLEQQYFLPFTDISKYDLVVSYLACGAAESIISNCSKNNIDFFIGICPCSIEAINEVMNNNLSEKEYLNRIIKFAKLKTEQNNLGILIEDKLEDKLEDEKEDQNEYDFPIIYNKRIKSIKYKRDA